MPESALESVGLPPASEDKTTLKTFNSFAIDLISIPNAEDLFWYVARNVVGRLNFVDCVIYQADDAQTTLTQVAALGGKNPFGRSIINPLKIPFGQGITGQVAQTRQAIIVDDLSLDENYIEDTQRARSEICVPVMCEDRIVGVIDSEHTDVAAFGADELEVLTTIAAMTCAKLKLLAEEDRSNRRYHDLVAAHAQLSRETTNRKALEAELFNARKLETVGRLTGRFAHEFNNLLTVMSGNLDLLQEDIADGPQREALQDAQTAATKGATLIQSMLTFSQRTRLTPTRQNLNSIVKDVVEQNVAANGPVIELSLGQDVGKIDVDRKILETVLQHLIANARDAMPQGGEIRVETDNITHALGDERSLVTPLVSGPYVRLSVLDFGNGIAPHELQQIFDPFYTTKPAGAGTGLGLSMTLGFMQQSGGTVAVQSVAGTGSTLELYFPAIPSHENDLLTIGR
ncbi:ATP-binding protein [Octadecabacter sp. G9-8]|uniref:histidine kinase n=1 Tax=Octadecabacter dasysiphoniae TaxID=2909341 RepID=A0ABS9CXV5_9RHOB|nr:ATP-binding protein [Octadecabacter dasysiphoniae]MCF2872063.1 ATP-binding protein [Octadecabacter dasysiphoniae]